MKRGPVAPRVPVGIEQLDEQGFEEEPPTKPGIPEAIRKSKRPMRRE